ncbi:MAG TPA: hypothetical protein VKT32_08310 [Chthonomonadaceae bacterium]|nr:hypothetical protein [Chthonomonadaceae bacterium]
MLSGRFAQIMETLSVALVLVGIVALCQTVSPWWFHNGFRILIAGWVGLTIWSHRRPVRPKIEAGNPQVTIDGHPPLDVTLSNHSAR